MLICFDKAERHLPDRCLRQYGMHQPIPEDVLRWERKSRGVDGGIDLSGKMESELSEWSDRRLHIVEGDEDVDDSEYMQWYLGITRKLVGRPIPISSEFQRMVNLCLDLLSATTSFHILGPGWELQLLKGTLPLFLMDSVGKLLTLQSFCNVGTSHERTKNMVQMENMLSHCNYNFTFKHYLVLSCFSFFSAHYYNLPLAECRIEGHCSFSRYTSYAWDG